MSEVPRPPGDLTGARWRTIRALGGRCLSFLCGDLARSCVSIGVLAFLLPALLSIAWGPPFPVVHDEFSYLLMSDTFAHGRVTNPSHPMWAHFESFHVLQTPTYASKYQPAQGLFLALGQLAAGFPIAGVWLSYGLAGAAVCWMLGGWLSPRWSLLGALLLVTRPSLVLSWGDSYWGGAVPLLGGALVLGAVPRLWRCTRMVDALALASGLVLLATSRPFEGLIAAVVPVAAVALRHACRPLDAPAVVLRKIVLPSSLVLASGACAIGYYNARVTGSPWRLPYVEYERQYSYVPVFGWQPIAEPRAYRHEVFARYYREWGEATYLRTSVSPARWRFKADLLRLSVYRAFLGPALLIPLIASAFALSGTAVIGLAMATLVLASNYASAWVLPHYFAPGAAGLYLLLTLGLRRLGALRVRNRRIGTAVVALVLAGVGLDLQAGWSWALTFAVPRSRAGLPAIRAGYESALARRKGKHLVIVRYQPNHNVHFEWVYNRADIDGAPVVWARELGEADDRRLLEYFRDRSAWLLLADEVPVKIVPLTSAPGQPAPDGRRDEGSLDRRSLQGQR